MVDSLSEILDDDGDWDGEEPADRLEADIVELQSATANATAALDDAIDSLETPRDDMESLEERVDAITEVHDRILAAERELLELRVTASITRDRLTDLEQAVIHNRELNVPEIEEIDLDDIDIGDI